MSEAHLEGCRVLVVEDEALIGLVLEDILETLGCALAGTCATLGEASPIVDSGAFDVAILDVHVMGEPVYPVADRILALGKPVIFATGATADSLPAQYRACPVLEKPYTFAEVEGVLNNAVAPTSA